MPFCKCLKSPYRLSWILGTFFSVLFLLFSLQYSAFEKKNKFLSSSIDLSFAVSPVILTSPNLFSVHTEELSYNSSVGKRYSSSYGYIWISIKNNADITQTFYVCNVDPKSQTKLLKKSFERTVLIDESPSKKKGFFPFESLYAYSISIQPSEKVSYVLEIYSPSDIVIAPYVLTAHDWYNAFSKNIIFITILKVLFYISISGFLFFCILLLKNKQVFFQRFFDFLLCLLPFLSGFIFYVFFTLKHVFVVGLQNFSMFFCLDVTLFCLAFHFFLLLKNSCCDEKDSLKNQIQVLQQENINHYSMVESLSKNILHENIGDFFSLFDSLLTALEVIENSSELSEAQKMAQLVYAESSEYLEEFQKKLSWIKPHATIKRNDFIDSGDLKKMSVFSLIDQDIETITFHAAVFDYDKKEAEKIKLMLAVKKISCIHYMSPFALVADVLSGNTDIVIVNPSTCGKDAFDVCSKIREKKSILELPILMINDFFAGYLAKRGFSMGVNDFIIKPFHPEELSLRVLSHIVVGRMYKKNAELVVSEREKRTFLYFLTHNVNTPLMLLLNQLDDYASRKDKEMQEEEQMVSDIRQSACEINDIVQNVLVTFRLSDGRYASIRQPFFIDRVFKNIKKSIMIKASAKNQNVVWDLNHKIDEIICDKTAFQGIVNNLVDNAVKFTPVGGFIRVSSYIKENAIIITVDDTGPGISIVDQKKLFTRYEKINTKATAGEVSTGLGLYVACELAKINGGEISYHDSVLKGSCFSFSLPFIEDV